MKETARLVKEGVCETVTCSHFSILQSFCPIAGKITKPFLITKYSLELKIMVHGAINKIFFLLYF